VRKRALFCWELGDHHGHVSPYLGLLDRLRDRGWSVTLALANTAPGGKSCREGGFRLLQAPVCRQAFSGIPEVPFSYAELLLGFGFGHAETLAGLVDAWCGLCALVEPDLLLSSNAPSSLLAARIEGIPAVRIGMGFDCPPAGERTPLTRPWAPGVDERLQKCEAHCLATINDVICLKGGPPANRVSEVLFERDTLLCTYPELDYFGPRDSCYLGVLPERPAPRGGEGEDVDIVAYVRMEHAHTERLLDAIRKTAMRAMVYCPDMSEAGRAHWTGPALRLSETPLDLDSWLPRCKIVVSYGGHGMTARSLLAGRPMLLLPTHLEQQFNAAGAAGIGAALVVRQDERNPKLKSMLEALKGDPRYSQAARQFSERHSAPSAVLRLADAVAACERAAAARTEKRIPL
jgi:hypothetical protein